MEKTQTTVADVMLQACEKLGYAPDSIVLDLSKFPEEFRKPVQSFANLLVAIKAKNDGHEFDYNDSNERKWFPVYDLEKTDENPGGFRFYVSDYFYDGAILTGGSRLCLRSQADSNEIGKTLAPLYKDILVIEK